MSAQSYWSTFRYSIDPGVQAAAADSPNSNSSGWGPRGMAAVGLEAYLLGVGGGVAVTLSFFTAAVSLHPFLMFCALLSIFHMTEFLFAAVYHSYSCSTESFLIPHSRAYTTAMAVSMLEFWVEWALFSHSSLQTSLFWIGFTISLSGQALRWTAFVTAGHNFTHQVAENKDSRHQLVTGGVYGFVRHPGYCGWFWWSVGTQIMLGNPVSAVAFFYFSWRFFVERIAHEESLLESKDFFGADYTNYKKRVPTYIPFIA